MLEFFMDGGWSMYPVLILGLLLVAAAARYARDLEPVRLRVVTWLSATLLAFSAQGIVVDLATVCWAVSDEKRVPADILPRVVFMGMKESTRPVILGLGLLGLAFSLVSIGVYRGARRELRAAQG